MSLLSSTQGTPERVWSLVSAVANSGGAIARAEADAWLNPGFKRGGVLIQEKPETVAQTANAATSLGALTLQDGYFVLGNGCPATSLAAFRDWTHDRMVSLDSVEKDAVILETYAWIVVRSDVEGTERWVHEWDRDRFADEADKALPPGEDDDGQRRINTTKMPALRRWLEFIGLMTTLPVTQVLPHPSAAARLARELKRAGLSGGLVMSANDILDLISQRMPYLDRGGMFADAAQRIGHPPPDRKVSPLLSAALRDLNDDGMITLQVLGDAGEVVRLSQAPPPAQASFHSVTIQPELVA